MLLEGDKMYITVWHGDPDCREETLVRVFTTDSLQPLTKAKAPQRLHSRTSAWEQKSKAGICQPPDQDRMSVRISSAALKAPGIFRFQVLFHTFVERFPKLSPPEVPDRETDPSIVEDPF